ncbi:hypothetical protein BT96DRAFT_1005912 [Gymnopus androsaceus JB14]|uniref:Uncharacterized protein n=1 Tax=Gymnopus androsaceus JB14 TaxID=1447944 RepID=A0A6A4GMR7_9AGAR|nr:hypothetical protein BT96DRAFT_1005912 [Gymnopus androsaceus JB14]
MTTRSTMDRSSLIMGSQSSTLTMESQSSTWPILAGEHELISGPIPKGVWRLQGLTPIDPKQPDRLADLTLAFFSSGGQDVALGALQHYNFMLMKDVLFFSKPEEMGLWLEYQDFLAYKISEPFLFLCPNPYDTLGKEYYLGWFHVIGDFIYSSLAEVKLSPTYPAFDVTRFRCKWGDADAKHIDLYSTMPAHECQQWVDTYQSCQLRLRFPQFNMEHSLIFMTSDCDTCRGTHRRLCPYQKHCSQGPSDTAKRLDVEVVRVSLVAEIILHVRCHRFILIKVPPCSGKSTLLDQIWEALLTEAVEDHLEKGGCGAVHRGTSRQLIMTFHASLRTQVDDWLGVNVDGNELADFMNIKRRHPLWICFDEVQRTYGDNSLWAALYSVATKTNTFVIAAGSFGSHTGSTSHSPLHMVPPEHCMTLFNQKDEWLSLAFTQKDIEGYQRCLNAPELHPYWDEIRIFASPCTLNVEWDAGAHPGVFAQMAKYFVKRVKQIQQQSQSTTAIPFKQLVDDFTSQCLFDANMEITADLGRCIPRPPSHCHNFPPPALLVFHTILEQGKIVVPTIDTQYSPIIVSNDCRIWDQTSSSPRIVYQKVPAKYRTPDVKQPISSLHITLLHGMIETEAIAATPCSRFLEVVPGNPGYKLYALCELHASDHVLTDFAQAAHDARQMGWLLQVPSVAGATLITLVHPTHWHKYYAEHLFSRTQTFENFSSINDLLCRALANFSTRVLMRYHKDQGIVRKSPTLTEGKGGFCQQ